MAAVLHLRNLLKKCKLNKFVSEIYKHSIWVETMYRINKLFLSEKKTIYDFGEFEMILDKDRPGLEKDLYLQGVREEETVELFKDELNEGMKVVDVGANIGYYSLLASQQVGESGKVIAIEPVEETFRRLEKNISLNDLTNIRILNKAVGEKKTTGKILNKKARNLNRITFENFSNSTKTKIISLDSVFNQRKVDVVRMDVQGFEYFVLKGMEEIISNNEIKIFIEIHPSKMESCYDVELKEFWDLLSKHNFKIKYLISHPLKVDFSSFLKPNHPDRKIFRYNNTIDEFLSKRPEIVEKGSFRAVIEN